MRNTDFHLKAVGAQLFVFIRETMTPVQLKEWQHALTFKLSEIFSQSTAETYILNIPSFFTQLFNL